MIRFETNKTLPIIKTDDKSFEQRDTSDDVKTHPEMVREPNAARETIALELYIHGMQVDRNEAAVAYLDIDTFTLLPYKAKKQSKINFEYTIGMKGTESTSLGPAATCPDSPGPEESAANAGLPEWPMGILQQAFKFLTDRHFEDERHPLRVECSDGLLQLRNGGSYPNDLLVENSDHLMCIAIHNVLDM